MKKTALYSIFCALALGVSAQNINSNNPTVPFGSNTEYQFGMMPTNLPTGGTYEGSQDAADGYADWYADWVRDCPDGSKYVRWDGGATSVSEGIAYGMIIAAYMGDKELLDDLWAFYEKAKNSNGVMGWQGNCSGATQSGGATDAEVDAAMALIVAEYQWPNINTPYDYEVEANELITAIYDHEVQSDGSTGANQLLPGDTWGTAGDNCRNPGYIPMGYLKCYAEHIGGAQQTDWENNIIPANYALLSSNFHPTTGLGSDWCSADGGVPSCGDGYKFGDDASRLPWRTAIDALWSGEASSTTVCSNMAKYCASNGGPANAPGDVQIDGSGSGSTQTIYRVMFGTGVMGMSPSTTLSGGYTPQSLVDAYYTNVKNANGLTDQGYFPEILRMISIMVMTGNFWKPGSESGACTKPDLGTAKSLCGAGSVLLDSGLPSGNNKTFTWYKDGNLESGPNSNLNTLNVTEAGVWTVEVDSANGECIVDAMVEVLGILPAIDLGNDIELCVPANATLDAEISGNGITYSWEKDNSVIDGENGQTLFISQPGTYNVTAEATGCSDVSDEIVVSSLLPEVEGDVVCPPGPVSLKVLTAGGPYQWYASPTDMNVLHTGSTFNTTVSTSTTFYVEDAGSIDLTVGLDATNNSLDGEAGRGVSQNEMVLTFDALTTFTLDAITVGYYSYNCTGDVVIQINIKDSNGDPIGSSTGTLPCDGQGPTIGRLVLDTPIEVPAGMSHTIDPNGSDNNMSWYENGASYPYGTTDIITFTGPHTALTWAPNSQPGFFDFEISTGNSCDRAAVVAEVDCVNAIFGSDNVSGLEIYPNPSEDQVFIQSANEVVNHITISDNTGRVIINISQSSIEMIDISQLEKGTYLLSVNDHVSQRFIKK